MKKRVFISILFSVLSICLGLNFSHIQVFLTGAEGQIAFYQQIAQLEHEYEYIYLDKDVDINTLQNALCIEEDKNANIALSSKKLTQFQIKEICQQNDYVVEEEEDGYFIRNKYSLKSLITIGQIDRDYGANKVISGYRDFSVLCYDSEEDTKNAYLSMLQDGVNVIINSVISADTNEMDVDVSKEDYYDGYMTWGAEAMGLQEYNTYLQTYNCGEEVVVAVLDTGINTSHVLFQNRILTDNKGQLVGYSFQDTVYTYSGYAFEDDGGHGTHVSGTITELTPSNVKILPIKVLNSEGKGDMSIIIGALELLEDYITSGYNIVCANMSLGGKSDDAYLIQYLRNEYDKIIKNFKNKYNMLTVVSAGNDYKDVSMYVPASAPEAITVSALWNNDGVYAFDGNYSNFGDYIDISAPGTYIKSAWINTTNGKGSHMYAWLDGTSMASPHVSAAVALYCIDENYYVENNATYTGKDIEERLYSGCVDLGDSGWDKYYGKGMLRMQISFQTIEYSVENCQATYDGNYHNINITVDNVSSPTILYGLSSDKCNLSNVEGNDAFKNQTNGVKTIYFKITAEGFISVAGVGYLTINKAPVTIFVQNQSFIYGDVNFDASKFTKTSGTILNADQSAFNLTTTASSNSGVGNYDITIDCTSDNYLLTSNTATLTISKRPLAIALSKQTTTYGEGVKLDKNAYSITTGSIVNKDDLGLKLVHSAPAKQNAGTYTITLDDYSNKNYDIQATAGTLVIEQRRIKIALINQNLQYSDIYNIQNTLFTVTEGNLITGDNLGLSLKTKDEIIGVGEYILQLSSYTNANYLVETCTEAKLSISQRPITVTVQNQIFTYGDNVAIDKTKYSVTKNTVIAGDDLGITISSSSGVLDAGNYPITLAYTNKNYSISVINGNVIVLPRKIIISIGNYQFTYGEVDLNKIEYSVIEGEILKGDKIQVNILTNITKTTEVGTYLVEASSSDDNYSITIEGGKVEIVAKDVTISTSQTKVYGDEVSLSGTDYQMVDGQVLEGDSLDIVFESTASLSSKVGEYEISIKSCNKNYNVYLSNGKLNVTKRPLQIVLRGQFSQYGDAVSLSNTAFDVKSSLPSFETIENLKISIFTSANQNSAVGKYNIDAVCNNSNYAFSYISANYRVVPRKITILVYDQSLPYSKNMVLDKTAYEVVSGSVLAGEKLNVNIRSTTNSFSSLGGRYVLTADCENDNYSVTVISGVLTVEASQQHMILLFAVPSVVLLVSVSLIFAFGGRKKKHRL